MKTLLILGAGTAGTMMSNHLRRRLDGDEWAIRIVDEREEHYYQPGFLFMPFGVYSERDVIRPQRKFIAKGVERIGGKVEQIDPAANCVVLANGDRLDYDILIVATGTDIAPDQTEGMLGADWQNRAFDFYSFEGARRLAAALKDWKGGRLVVHISEMPIKCPVAPLEFTFLADAWLAQNGLRDKTELVFVTPLSGAFTKPVASKILSHLLEEKKIQVVNDFAIGSVDSENHKIVSWDNREVDYDMLVTVPTNMGSEAMDRSGLGDEFNYVPVDKATLRAKGHENIFALGDATDAPTSKAGSVAHFQAEILTENIMDHIAGRELSARFDGHANCFIESGYGKAFLLDFNYEQEPVTGTFPIPGLGPMKLLGETRLNHWGKMAFKWVYWNMLLQARPIPLVKPKLSLAGKNLQSASVEAAIDSTLS